MADIIPVVNQEANAISSIPRVTLSLLAAAVLQACASPGPTGVPARPTATPTSLPSAIPTSAPGATATPSPARPTEIPPRLQPATPSIDSPDWQSPIDGMILLPIPAGSFWMGTLPSFEFAEPDERPQRRVSLSGFWIDKTEITREMYHRCADEGACPITPIEISGEGLSPLMPQTHVTWEEAAAYCRWAGRELPTEAQWERASRGSDGRRFPWGWIGAAETRAGVRLNFCDASCPFQHGDRSVDDGSARLAEVGSYPAGASPSGALDMAGNVWEWVRDWYDASYYANAQASDPTGPATGRFKVVRGSSWAESTFAGQVLSARSANRSWQLPEARGPDLGFRCAVAQGGD